MHFSSSLLIIRRRKVGDSILYYDEAILYSFLARFLVGWMNPYFEGKTARYKKPCTMMKPYFKGKTASTKPMYSRNLIHPRVYENTPQLHSKV